MRKNIAKKIICISIIISLISIYTPKKIYAADDTQVTVESARQQIVNWAVNFVNSGEAQKSIYHCKAGYQSARAATYNGGYPQSSYQYDCVGFVNFVLHQSLGIDYAPAASGAGGFVTPGGIKATSYFSAIDISGDKISAAQPGDILISSSHVAIMVADGQVVDCIDSNGGRDNYDTSGNAVKIRSIASESGWATYTTAARLVSVDGVNFSPIDGGIFVPDGGDDQNGDSDDDDDSGQAVDLDVIANLFKYQGMPSDITYKHQEVDGFRWLFNSIGGILNYLVGGLTFLIRASIMGWLEVIQDTVNNVLHIVN